MLPEEDEAHNVETVLFGYPEVNSNLGRKKSIAQTTYKWKPNGSRRRSRPRHTWLQTIKKEAQEHWENIEGRAQDRNAWMDFTKAL